MNKRRVLVVSRTLYSELSKIFHLGLTLSIENMCLKKNIPIVAILGKMFTVHTQKHHSTSYYFVLAPIGTIITMRERKKRKENIVYHKQTKIDNTCLESS